MAPGEPSDAQIAEINHLYWDTDTGVNRIAEEEGISKGVLYSLVEPQGSGMICPACGEELVYHNRTARERGFVSCPECGFEEEADALAELVEGDDSSLAPPPRALAERGGFAPARDLLRDDTAWKIAGAALVGIVAGVALVDWIRKR